MAETYHKIITTFQTAREAGRQQTSTAEWRGHQLTFSRSTNKPKTAKRRIIGNHLSWILKYFWLAWIDSSDVLFLSVITNPWMRASRFSFGRGQQHKGQEMHLGELVGDSRVALISCQEAWRCGIYQIYWHSPPPRCPHQLQHDSNINHQQLGKSAQ